MNNRACTEQDFLKDVREHEMIVIRDDGVNRHIRFKRPQEGAYWFDIITWPGTALHRWRLRHLRLPPDGGHVLILPH